MLSALLCGQLPKAYLDLKHDCTYAEFPRPPERTKCATCSFGCFCCRRTSCLSIMSNSFEICASKKALRSSLSKYMSPPLMPHFWLTYRGSSLGTLTANVSVSAMDSSEP
ncbi:hypothetical protein M3J09_012069 [Ascochyta lentis]